MTNRTSSLPVLALVPSRLACLFLFIHTHTHTHTHTQIYMYACMYVCIDLTQEVCVFLHNYNANLSFNSPPFLMEYTRLFLSLYTHYLSSFMNHQSLFCDRPLSSMAIFCLCFCWFSVFQYAHHKCVQRWCDEKGDTICEICHEVNLHVFLSQCWFEELGPNNI